MTKKHKQRSSRPARGPLPRRALVTLQDALWLMERHAYADAREKLETLNRQFPQNPDILLALLDVLFEVKDMPAYQTIAEELVDLVPDNPDLLLNLAGSYATNIRPVSALYAFRKFVALYPNDPRVVQVRENVAELEARLPEFLADLHLSGPDAERAAILHERSLALIDQHEFKRARRVIDELLQLKPDFIPALNNSSNLYYAEGNLKRAAELAQQALDRDPENIQALSNLTRFLCLQGRVAEAQTLAAKLKTVESERLDAETKQVEALAMLGDDEGILEVFERAEKRGRLKEPFVSPLVFHAAAVAALRLGDEKRAKNLWQRALDVAPTYAVARANLDDLKKPVEERHAPWTFTLAEWVPEKTVRDLIARVTTVMKRGDAALAHATQRFFRDHPEVRALIPLLLDRGDPAGREFAFHLASAFDAPDMKTALRDFALSQRGPDQLRMKAAQQASRAGLIPPGTVRMYIKGEWLEILLLGMEITDEPTTHLRPVPQALYEQAHAALLDDDPARAEALLLQADALQPNDPAIRHNLAMAVEMQGRRDQAEMLLRENHARHPDYLFSRVTLARLAVNEGQLDRARTLLEPVLHQKRFHISEFAAFAGAQIDLLLAENEVEGARQWFDLWSSIDPDHPQLDYYRTRFNPLARFLRR